MKNLEHTLDKFESTIRSLEYFTRSTKCLLANDPFLLVRGEAGMGKTHLVCDIARARIKKGLPPTIIVLGEELLNISDPLRSILAARGIKKSKRNVLETLNALGQKKKSRALIIVDAINEADRIGWKRGVRSLIKEIRRYPWIGLVMTCRTPFESLSLPKRIKIISELHSGFSEHEMEAMSAFFKFYDIPLPQVPLLINEFASPLFLGCFCKTAQSIKNGRPKVAKDIQDLALGQTGMTKILEDFFISKQQEILEKYSGVFSELLKDSFIWNKGGDDCLIKKVAEKMALNTRRYLTVKDIFKIIRQQSAVQYTEKQCNEILNIFIGSGIFIRDAAWDQTNKRYFDVIKLPFHKFSDHIIARYLIHPNFLKARAVSKSLKAATPLGNIFRDEASILNNIDLVEALMVEFPERIKKNKRLSEKDLIDYIPKKILKHPLIRNAYIRSLYWRRPDNFLNTQSQIKKSVINYFNSCLLRYRDSSEGVLNLFIATGVKPLHPLNAKLLDRYLTRFEMNSRDIFWSEFLRKQDHAGAAQKLISWIENSDLSKIESQQAEAVINVLGWILTTSAHLLRDRATKCIYSVGKVQPLACFKMTLKLMAKNDPYIRERMLAASYGVAMANSFQLNNEQFLKDLYMFARKIYSGFFKSNADFSTTHLLTRDYASQIIALALFHNGNLFTKKQIKKTKPPYETGGIRAWKRAKDKDEGRYRDGNSPLGMDFENYTLGSLVSGRRNYDYENSEFKVLKENILWRIYNLGYSLEKFGEVDKEIVSNSNYNRRNDATKIDRYGKKYSWIAYYEMIGFKMDRGELPDYLISNHGRRGYESEIDPSFPILKYEKPLHRKNLTKGPTLIEPWLVQKSSPDISDYVSLKKVSGQEGPWSLVHGTIGSKNTVKKRRITTWITGIIVQNKDLGKVREFFRKTKYPGNEKVPQLQEIGSLFAGEINWRELALRQQPEKNTFLQIQRGTKKVKLTRKELSWQDVRILYQINGVSTPLRPTRKLPKRKYKIVPIFEKIKIELLSRWFSSKDYSRMEIFDNVGLNMPSRRITKKLGLYQRPGTFDLVDGKGRVASIPFVCGDQYGTHENLLYIREDLMKKIIGKNRSLCLLTFGERQFWPPDHSIGHVGGKISSIYQKNKNVYKKVIYPLL